MDKVGEVMEKRDLLADMEICEKATPGPWVGEENTGVDVYKKDVPHKGRSSVFETGCGCCTAQDLSREDATFIATSREGWPHAIHRAIAAEARVRVLEEALRDITSRIKTEVPDLNKYDSDDICIPGCESGDTEACEYLFQWGVNRAAEIAAGIIEDELALKGGAPDD